jgi:RimJ/RimL family protein N-acetyltransferase
MPFPLFTERLRISPLTLTDLGAFVEYRRDPEIARFQSWEPTYSHADARKIIESQAGLSTPETGEWLQIAIHNRESGELLGDVALHSVSEGDGVFEIGFTIARQRQGVGFATEAVARMMDYLFADCGATKLVANSDRRNEASITVLRKLGFALNPSLSWTEIFKGEEVEVDCFEAGRKNSTIEN